MRDNAELPVNWSKISVVIFDIDGTLYDQRRLRLAMMGQLIQHYLFKPHAWKDLLILATFRKVREEIADSGLARDIDNIQYAITANRLKIKEKSVRSCTEKWILNYPLSIIEKFRFPYIAEFCNILENRAIHLAAFSDYPVEEKLKALKLPQMYPVCSSASDIDAMKPDPKGLYKIINHFCVRKESCLLIGDRDDRDGECARRAGVKYLLKVKEQSIMQNHFKCYHKLLTDITCNLGSQ